MATPRAENSLARGWTIAMVVPTPATTNPTNPLSHRPTYAILLPGTPMPPLTHPLEPPP